MTRDLKFQNKEKEGLHDLCSEKTKAQISCTTTVQIICAFVFTFGFLMTQTIQRLLYQHLSVAACQFEEKEIIDGCMQLKNRVTSHRQFATAQFFIEIAITL